MQIAFRKGKAPPLKFSEAEQEILNEYVEQLSKEAQLMKKKKINIKDDLINLVGKEKVNQSFLIDQLIFMESNSM